MRTMLTNAWRRVRDSLRRWRAEVREALGFRPARPDPAASLARFGHDPWHLAADDLFGFRNPRVHVYRDGPDVVMEAEERQDGEGIDRGLHYRVSTYHYVSERRPASGALDVDALRDEMRARLRGGGRRRRLSLRAR